MWGSRRRLVHESETTRWTIYSSAPYHFIRLVRSAASRTHVTMAGEGSSSSSSSSRTSRGDRDERAAADITTTVTPQSSASTSKASPTITAPATRCNTGETVWDSKDHDYDAVDEEDEEEGSVIGDVNAIPQQARKGRSTSFVDAQRPPRPTAGAADEEASRCAGPGGPHPAQLCRQSSRASNRPPSPHYPHIALSLSRSVSAPGAVYIDWEENDPEDPLNWPARKKWTLVIAVFLFTAITAIIGELT